MRVPAAVRRVKLLWQAKMGFGGEMVASRSTGGMPERWGTGGQCDSFHLVFHHLEVTR